MENDTFSFFYVSQLQVTVTTAFNLIFCVAGGPMA